MLPLKLQALGLSPKCSNVQDDECYQLLFRGLEENALKQVYGKERNFLYGSTDSFITQLPQYMDSLDCPKHIMLSNREKVADWVLDLAINKVYDFERADVMTAANVRRLRRVQEEVSSLEECLREHVQMNTCEFRSWLKDVLHSVGLDKLDHADTATLLRALIVYVKQAMDSSQSPSESNVRLSLSDLPPDPNSSGSSSLDRALKTIHLLNVAQFRQLQTKVNECLVQIQNVTANPKTDLNLGKLGR